MGFGRVGRNVFRQLRGHPFLEVGAIADVADPVGLAYLLKYDSIYGRYPEPVSYRNGLLVVGDQATPLISAEEIAWSDLGVSLVVQSTGRHHTMQECRRHIDAGARGVVLASTPQVLGEIPILLRGVNDHLLTPDTEVIALGSNTSNALAPILWILADTFGLRRGFFTSVHAMTNAQRLADVPTSGFRSSRAAADNIIPSPTNTAEILAAARPEFAGKLSSLALNVPVVDGSNVDLVAELETAVDRDQVNRAIRQACETHFSGIVEYSTDPIVSTDVTGAPESAVFDSLATMVMGDHMTKTVTWYNNGWGYSARIVEVLERMGGV
jgi:glyceraldehyde 3-phosphate dehydrogenase